MLGMGDGDERDPARRGPVEVGQLRVEGTVDGGGHRQVRVVGGMERSHDRVVVDDVAFAHGLVGVQHVAQFGHGHADALSLRLGQHPLAGHRAGRVAGGVEQHLVSRLLQPAGQLVDDQLDAAVERGWDGGPGRGDQSDAHVQI